MLSLLDYISVSIFFNPVSPVFQRVAFLIRQAEVKNSIVYLNNFIEFVIENEKSRPRTSQETVRLAGGALAMRFLSVIGVTP